MLRKELPDTEELALVLREVEGEALTNEDDVSTLEAAALPLALRL